MATSSNPIRMSTGVVGVRGQSARSTSAVTPLARPIAGPLITIPAERTMPVAERAVSPIASCSDSEHDAPVAVTAPVLSLEYLADIGVTGEVARTIMMAASASAKRSRKAPAERKTPDGLVGCRLGIMAIMGELKQNAKFTGQRELLEVLYNLVGCDIKDGPLKAATPILTLFSGIDNVYEAWQNIAKARTEAKLKRGQDKTFFLNKIGAFIASACILLAEQNIDLTVNSHSVKTWASQDFNSNSLTFQRLFGEYSDAPAEGAVEHSCAAKTQKGTPCQKAGKKVHGEHYYCTQHFKLL